ncbi:PREDICTED: protein Spindly-like [Polistes dominula]|uniref:Protein Spindly-like n=1 Tax=Polistes dominula TaxID=743375 RepID=A0ABM1IP12_POLDO|nr:PREDICTED: protein Spindly-like [Polistes dominula]
MSDTMISSDESAFINSKSEYLSETLDGNALDCRKLQQQNENYRQELHELQLKLIHTEAMQKELQEANESLEQLLLKEQEKAQEKIHKIQEKNRENTEVYENELADLGLVLDKKEKENKELHESLQQLKVKKQQDKPLKIDDIEDKLKPLKEQIQELLYNLEDERRKREDTEDYIKDLKSQLVEHQEILQDTKNNLREKTEGLETVREELAICRSELETLRITPASETCKGNSLFAEVEDRYRLTLDKATTMKKKYDELKRAYGAKCKEINSFKIEKASLLKKWDECMKTFSDDDELTNRYKNRIRDLEKKLAEIQEVEKTTNDDDDSFSYMEKLLAEKKKQIQELNQKIERDSVDMLFQMEMKHKVTKQMQYWRYRAMYMETQLSAIQSQLELENICSSDCKSIFEKIEQHKINCKDTLDKQDMKNIEMNESEIMTFEDASSMNNPKCKNVLQTKIDNLDIKCNSNTDQNHLDNVSNKFVNTKLDGNANVGQCKTTDNVATLKYNETTNLNLMEETQKLKKNVQFTEDTKDVSGNESTFKKKLSEDKKKTHKPYQTMYISSSKSSN